MLVIRFARTGRRNYAQYRIVLQENSATPTGRHSEVLGSYDPHHKKLSVKEDRVNHWLKMGAKASDSVHNLLVKEGVIKEEKRAIKMKKSATKEAEGEAPTEKKEETKEEVKEETKEEAKEEEKK